MPKIVSMNIKQRKLYDDWMTAEQRMAGHRINEDSTIAKLTKGICAVSLSVLAVWLLWQLTTPAGIAAIYGALK